MKVNNLDWLTMLHIRLNNELAGYVNLKAPSLEAQKTTRRLNKVLKALEKDMIEEVKVQYFQNQIVVDEWTQKSLDDLKEEYLKEAE